MRRFLCFVLAFASMCAALTPLAALAAEEPSLFLGMTDEDIAAVYHKLPEFGGTELTEEDIPTAEELLLLTAGGTTVVWVSRTGHCYHRDYGCGNMENPAPATRTLAEDIGRRACKRCVGQKP